MASKKFLKKNRKGSALVEFAVVATALIPLLLYITLFSEIIHFRMKIDEMNYFAAWELASYGLSDYSQGNSGGGAFNSNENVFNKAKEDIVKRTKNLYKSLDSADPERGSSFLMLTPDPSSLKVEMEKVGRKMPTPTVTQDDGPKDSGIVGAIRGVISKLDSLIASGIDFVLGQGFGFNTRGIGAKVTVSGSFTVSKRFNPNAGNKDTGGFSHGKLLQDAMLGGASTYAPHSFMVWTDTWALKTGENVINTKTDKSCISVLGDFNCPNEFSDYAKQVQRMSLIGTWWGGRIVRGLVNLFGSGFISLLGKIPIIGDLFGAEEEVSEARMVSINYYYDTLKTQRKGNYTAGVSKGQSQFQTSPIVYIFRNSLSKNIMPGIKEYKETLEKRRNFYMGNNKPYCQFNGTGEQCQ